MARNEVDFIAAFFRSKILRKCVGRVHLRLFYSARSITFLIRPQRDVERLFAISLIS
jgi:hypothetical protein